MDVRAGGIDKAGSSPLIAPPKQDKNVNPRLVLLSKPHTKPNFPVYRTIHTPPISPLLIPTIKQPPHNVRSKHIGPQKRNQQKANKAFQLDDHRRIEGKFLYNELDIVKTSPIEDNVHARRVCSNIFFYLWAKNSAGKSCPLVRIPDTIVVQSGCIRFWFFTGKDQQLKRKRREKMDDWRYVLRMFARRTSQGPAEGHQRTRAIHVTYTEKQKSTDDGIQLVGLNEQGLNKLLREGTFGIPDGLLQKYFGSRGPHHTMYVATWQQTLFSVSETLVEIDNDSELTGALRLPPRDVSLTIQTRVKEICDSVVQHVHQVSPQKYLINELKLHFKLDAGGALWLVFCSDIKVSNLVFSPPSTIVRTHAYNPFTVPQYFKQSSSLEKCARLLRKSITEDADEPFQSRERSGIDENTRSMGKSSTRNSTARISDLPHYVCYSPTMASVLTKEGSPCLNSNSVKQILASMVRKKAPRNSRLLSVSSSRRRVAHRQPREKGDKREYQRKPVSPQPQQLPRSSPSLLKDWMPACVGAERRKGTSPFRPQVTRVEDESRSERQSTLDGYREWLKKPRPQTAADCDLRCV